MQNLKDISEEEFVNRFLSLKLPYRLFKKKTINLLEPKLPVGFPDIVKCTLKKDFEAHIKRKPVFDYNQLKLLHYLYLTKGVTIETIKERLLFGNSFVNDNIDLFYSNGLVSIIDNTVRLKSLENIFVINRIVAIEAKLNNWKDVLHQAARNQWFASESYILMPPKNNFGKIMASSKKFGIGILTVQNNSIKVLLKSTKEIIPISYGSWVINEMIIKKLKDNV